MSEDPYEDIQNPVSEKIRDHHMSDDPYEDLEKLDPLHVQSDTGCNKAQRPFSCFLHIKIKNLKTVHSFY